MLNPKLHEITFSIPPPDTLPRSLSRLPQVECGQSIFVGPRNRLARGSSSRADPAHGRARTLTTSESFAAPELTAENGDHSPSASMLPGGNHTRTSTQRLSIQDGLALSKRRPRRPCCRPFAETVVCDL